MSGQTGIDFSFFIFMECVLLPPATMCHPGFPSASHADNRLQLRCTDAAALGTSVDLWVVCYLCAADYLKGLRMSPKDVFNGFPQA